jgi:hypothetical protein
MSPEEKLDLLLSKLDCITKVLAFQYVSGKKPFETACILDRAGLDRKLIAEVLDTSPDSVRAMVSQARRSPSKKYKDK